MKRRGFHLSYADAIQCISEIVKGYGEFCRFSFACGLDSHMRDSKISYGAKHPVGSLLYTPMQIRIGTKDLQANMSPDGFVRDEDAVRAVFASYHEGIHLWQYSVVLYPVSF